MIVAGDVSHLPYEFPQNCRALTTCSVVVQDNYDDVSYVDEWHAGKGGV